jgi:hypothetical protein
VRACIALQHAVGKLDLIPDVPLRPARVARDTLVPGFARVCNLHPSCMGSIVDAVTLASRVREINANLMIGDDSLIGPGCPAWQQLAIGLGAAWVEAIEKPEENNTFTTCVRQTALTRTNNGKITTNNTNPTTGLGIEIDREQLRQSTQHLTSDD